MLALFRPLLPYVAVAALTLLCGWYLSYSAKNEGRKEERVKTITRTVEKKRAMQKAGAKRLSDDELDRLLDSGKF